MKYQFMALNLALAAALAGCGGGGSGSGLVGGGYGNPPVNPKPGPSAAPTTAPGGVLATHSIDGGTAFVNSVGHAVYVSDGDTQNNVSTCNGQCAAEWPAVAPPAGNLPAPWGQFRRSDGTMQLSYKGKPLYTFAGDTQPYVASGNNLGASYVARP